MSRWTSSHWHSKCHDTKVSGVDALSYLRISDSQNVKILLQRYTRPWWCHDHNLKQASKRFYQTAPLCPLELTAYLRPISQWHPEGKFLASNRSYCGNVLDTWNGRADRLQEVPLEVSKDILLVCGRFPQCGYLPLYIFSSRIVPSTLAQKSICGKHSWLLLVVSKASINSVKRARLKTNTQVKSPPDNSHNPWSAYIHERMQ